MIEFYKHQLENIDFKTKHNRAFDTSTCGTGKTLSTLESWRRRNDGKLMVIAPKSTLEAVWYNDAKALNPDMAVAWFDRNQQRKDSNYIKKICDQNDIVVINIEAVDLVLQNCHLTPFSTLVVDEFTSIKNRNAQRSKNVELLSQHFDNLYLLSGTPIPNGILDIWHPAFVLDRGERLGRNFSAFRNIVCQPVLKTAGMRQFTEWVELPGAIEEVGNVLRDVTIRHVLEDVVDMPERLMVERVITMPDKLRKMYDELKAQAILQLKTDRGTANKVYQALMEDPTTGKLGVGALPFPDDTDDIVAVNKAVLYNKLLQVASGSAYLEGGGSRLLDTSKYELICDLILERPASLVFFIWQHQRDALAKLLDKHKVPYAVIDGNVSQAKRAEIVRDFQDGKYRTVLLQPAAAAHGITLTRSVASIWCSPTYNLEHFLQANHRDYRIGQTKRSEVIMVRYRGTLEGEVYKRLQQKNSNLNDLLSILES